MCDRCYDVLKPADLQNALAGHLSKAAQLPIHDVTDWTSMRAWLNNPLTSSLEQDIFKSTTILECAPHDVTLPLLKYRRDLLSGDNFLLLYVTHRYILSSHPTCVCVFPPVPSFLTLWHRALQPMAVFDVTISYVSL